MKMRFTASDVHAIAQELQILDGKYIKNIYQCEKNIYIRVGLSGPHKYIVFAAGMFLYLAMEKREDTRVTRFVEIVRDTVSNSKVSSVRVLERTRSIEVSVLFRQSVFFLVFELYANGNLVLLDSSRKIITASRLDSSSGIVIGSEYKYSIIFFKTPVEHTRQQIIKSSGAGPVIGAAIADKYLAETSGDREDLETFVTRQMALVPCSNAAGAVISKHGKLESFEGSVFHRHKEYLASNGYTVEEYVLFSECIADYLQRQKKPKKQDTKLQRMINSQCTSIRELKKKNTETEQLIEDIVHTHYSVVEEALRIAGISLKHLAEKEFCYFHNQEKSSGDMRAAAIARVDFIAHKAHLWIGKKKVVFDPHVSLQLHITKMYQEIKKNREKIAKIEQVVETWKEQEEEKEKKAVCKIAAIKKKKTYWFEAFSWFITTDRFLCIAGKNIQQNEIVVKKHMESRDIYLHADIQGAASVVLKGREDRAEIPQNVINSAGEMALIHSKAWKGNMIHDVFWVDPEQVSKSALPGEYVSPGSFIIKGKKNMLVLHRMEAGLGIIFKKVPKEGERLEDLFVTNIKDIPEKEIEYAIPVCGPYSAINKYRLHIKIVSGPGKRNKIIKDAQAIFMTKATEKEKKFVTYIDHDEFDRVLVFNAKLAANLTDIKSIHKKSRKSNK